MRYKKGNRLFTMGYIKWSQVIRFPYWVLHWWNYTEYRYPAGLSMIDMLDNSNRKNPIYRDVGIRIFGVSFEYRNWLEERTND